VKFSAEVTNSPPTDLALSNNTIDENVAANAEVGTFNGTFDISGNQLTINSSPDFETKSSYSIRVQTTDGDGVSYQEQLTINVNDVNEAPIDIAPSIAKNIGSSSDDKGYGIATDSDGNVWIIGYFKSSSIDINGNGTDDLTSNIMSG